VNIKTSYKILAIFCLVTGILSCFTVANYRGSAIVYIIFAVLLNAFFIQGFTRRRIYFDTFLGIFFWLGFWLKFSVRVAFMGGVFQEPVGQFDGAGAGYDHALLVTSCGVAALLVASAIRRLFFWYGCAEKNLYNQYIFKFYQEYRKPVLLGFVLSFVAVAFSNVIFGIYQRGTVPRTILPLGLNGVYTWLLLFGFASITALILDCELRLKHDPYLVSTIGLLESFFSNSSMLSRGMILNGGALVIGLIDSVRRRFVDINLAYKLFLIVVLLVLFVASVSAVNYVRKDLFFSYPGNETSGSPSLPAMAGPTSAVAQVLPLKSLSDQPGTLLSQRITSTINGIKVLLIDRWVGIEGVMAVSSYKGLGWDLWKEAWQEKYSDSGTSMFDKKILEYKYLDVHLSRHHFINLPGIVAFFYYPGSMTFLFFSMVLVGFIGAAVELFVYKLSGANIILCSLLGEVVAYRYAHFGYVPAQSYLLFGSIFLSVFLIYLLEKFFAWTQTRNNDIAPSSS